VYGNVLIVDIGDREGALGAPTRRTATFLNVFMFVIGENP
jgi:hypothetical protein